MAKGIEFQLRQTQRRRLDRVDPLVLAVIADLAAGARPWPLTLMGSTGAGKTCTALVVTDYVVGVRYTTAAELSADLIDAEFGRLQSGSGHRIHPRNFWNSWESTRLAVLDEVGLRGKVSDAQYQNVLQAIDRRHARPLVVITNLCMRELHQTFDDRVASRLAAGTVLRFSGDRRNGEPCRVTLAERAS